MISYRGVSRGLCLAPGCTHEKSHGDYCPRHHTQIKVHGNIKGNPGQSRKDKNHITISGDECHIHLNDKDGFYNHVTIIDLSDLHLIRGYKWSWDGRDYVSSKKDGKTIYLHNIIYGKLPAGFEVDHKNRNRLINKRSNLRVSTKSQNDINRPGKPGSSSQYKGVCWDKRKKKFKTYICKSGKYYHLGYFDDEKAAALTYNEKARVLFGEYAWLNQI